MPRAHFNPKESKWAEPILRALAQYPFLDSFHLYALIGTPYHQENARRAINNLLTEKLIERIPNGQVGRSDRNDPWTLRLTPKGFTYLDERNLRPRPASYTNKPDQHNLLANGALASFQLAFTKAAHRFITLGDIVANAPEEIQELDRPDCFVLGERTWVTPDQVFSVDFGDDSYACFCLLLDLTNHGQTYYQREADYYRQVVYDKIYQRQFGMKQHMYVLYLCTNEPHMRNVQTWTGGDKIFLYKTMREYGSYQPAPEPALKILAGWQGNHPNLGELYGHSKAAKVAR